MKRAHVRSWMLGAGAVALAVLVSACSGIPTSGDVQRSDVKVEPPAADIEFLPASPVAGDSQEGILRGFIDAASSPQNDFAVAREFLATTFTADWVPNANVTIDLGSRELIQTGDTTMSIHATVQATVDSAGNYSEFDSTLPASFDYSFVMEDGEWRIASAPPGVLLERYTFDQVYAPHALYFFDPSFSLLVPDLRYFPSRASTPTRIMKALLMGPSPWLAQSGAVVTAFPSGTKLVADTVPITGTSASVDVTATALETTAEAKRRMLRQTAASLGSLSSIFTVQLSIEGVPQDISAQSEDASASYPQVDARPLVIANGVFGYIQPTGAVQDIARVSAAASTYQSWAASYSDSHHAATLNTNDGLVLIRSSGSTALVDSRSDLAPGVFDHFGYIWSVPRAQDNNLYASTISGLKRFVSTPWPAGGRVVAISLSRDGTRVAAVIESGLGTNLYVSGIARDGQNGPISVGPPLVMPVPVGTATHVVWADSLTVAVLTTQSGGNALVTLNVVGGSSTVVNPGVPGLTLSAGNTVSELFMRAGDGSLYSYRASGTWPIVASGVSVQAQVQ